MLASLPSQHWNQQTLTCSSNGNRLKAEKDRGKKVEVQLDAPREARSNVRESRTHSPSKTLVPVGMSSIASFPISKTKKAIQSVALDRESDSKVRETESRRSVINLPLFFVDLCHSTTSKLLT